MVCVWGRADSYRLALLEGCFIIYFSVMSCSEGIPSGQTHDNFPKVLKIIAVRENSGEHSVERGNVGQGVAATMIKQQ